MDDLTGSGGGRALRVQLDIDLDRQPVTGRLRTREGAVERFTGWLGFVDALRRLHDLRSTTAPAGDQHTPVDHASTSDVADPTNREEPP